MVKTLVRTLTLVAITTTAVLFADTRASRAQSNTSIGVRQIGSQFVVLPRQSYVPPQYYVTPQYYAAPRIRHSDANLLNHIGAHAYWQVGLRTRTGTVIRSYRVRDSAKAMQLARREYPNAAFISVRKRYR